MQQTVTCRICGHEAATLARHLKAAHGVAASAYREQYPDARIRSEACEANRRAAITKAHEAAPRTGLRKPVVCGKCGVTHEIGLTSASKDTRCQDCRLREKVAAPKIPRASPLKGRTLSPETKAKMSANAGRWNAGLTKETDDRVAGQAEKMAGRIPWSKGLTKADHPSLRATSEKLSRLSGALRTWSNGLRADLSDVDFTPYLDETGAVDRRLMAEELGLSEPTITKYMEAAGLRLSTKYVDARAERQKVCIEKADLERFKLGNGKVVVAQAMVGLGHGFKAIKRECARHGLETFHHRVRQTLCLDAVSKVLGGAPYEQEWSPRRFTNPATGHRFRFDGYFPSHNLVVEFHGYQHYVFPSVYIKDEALYFALQERDRLKENLIQADPTLRYFLIREDEPYADPEYLRGRLLDEGYLDP